MNSVGSKRESSIHSSLKKIGLLFDYRFQKKKNRKNQGCNESETYEREEISLSAKTILLNDFYNNLDK